ncbi:YaaR family protein [Acetivibrio saccincola]|nr:YaaR family protein [Acetivibrio saccincola]
MRIKETVANTAGIQGITTKEEKKVIEGKETSFKNHLKEMDKLSFEERIKHLVNKIEEQGEKLSKKIDLRELKIYKRLIADFLDEVVSNSHKFTKDSTLDRRGRYKVYATVKKINKELDELTQEVLKEEKDNIAVLKKIEDIRGLVLDLFI